MGIVPLDRLPTTREVYDTQLRAGGSTQYKAGYLPYSIIDGWQQIRKDFAYWRAAVKGAETASSAQERAWFEADRRLRENRFGSPLELSRIHWVRPEVVVEVNVPDLDRGPPPADGLIPGSARGQAGEAGRSVYAASSHAECIGDGQEGRGVHGPSLVSIGVRP